MAKKKTWYDEVTLTRPAKRGSNDKVLSSCLMVEADAEDVTMNLSEKGASIDYLLEMDADTGALAACEILSGIYGIDADEIREAIESMATTPPVEEIVTEPEPPAAPATENKAPDKPTETAKSDGKSGDKASGDESKAKPNGKDDSGGPGNKSDDKPKVDNADPDMPANLKRDKAGASA